MMTRLANLRRSFPTLMLLGAPLRSPIDDAARFADAFDHLKSKLLDPTLNAIAVRKLKRHNVEEIGGALGTSTKTIDRKLRVIRAIWEEAVG